MDRSAQFWDRMAARYSKRAVSDEAAYQRKLQVTREYFRPDMEVLEFGCGTGSTAIAQAPHVKHIRAVDISSNMLEIAKGKAEAAGVENITFERASIDELSLDDQSFDAVLGLSILHLLENRDRAIAKVYQLLKPGGVFVTSTICMGDSWFKYLALIARLGESFGLTPLLRVFSVNDLVASFTNAGFEIDHQWLPGDSKVLFAVAKKPST